MLSLVRVLAQEPEPASVPGSSDDSSCRKVADEPGAVETYADACAARRELMLSVNPRIVLRNHVAQQAIAVRPCV